MFFEALTHNGAVYSYLRWTNHHRVAVCDEKQRRWFFSWSCRANDQLGDAKDTHYSLRALTERSMPE